MFSFCSCFLINTGAIFSNYSYDYIPLCYEMSPLTTSANKSRLTQNQLAVSIVCLDFIIYVFLPLLCAINDQFSEYVVLFLYGDK